MAESVEFDIAAEQAKQELIQNIDKWTAKEAAGWWSRWFLKAGHKRLGRIFVETTKPKKV